jgi:hypothetical protein
MRLGSLALVMALAAVGLAGSSCSYRNETINRVVDPYWRKSDFSPDNEWYVRTTIVDAPPDHPWVSIADGDWLMLEKIRWEITETHLIGWRDYPVVPGTELENYPGGEDIYKGEPVAMFRITDHFDIQKDFDPSTGEEGNTIGENRDRLWYDRALFRVDWSTNLVPTYKFHIWLNQVFNTSVVVQNDVADPKRYRFETDKDGKLDYFEVTTRTQVQPDIYTYFGWYGIPYAYDPAGAMLDMRHSFMRVPKSDYEPLPMPPSVVLEDADGNEVRDEAGNAVRIPINDRFGYFGTLGRLSFDQNRGMVQSGQIFNAARFNIWKRHKNDDGSIIPTDQREPKPIVYYGNVEHPEGLINGSKRVAAEWNRAFRDMIWKLQPNKYSGALDATGIPEDVPEMFIFKRNDCNFDNVKDVLDTYPKDLVGKIEEAAVRKSYNPDVVGFDGTFADAKARFDHAQDETTGASFTDRQSQETQALNDLERICSAMEYFSNGDVTLGIPPATDEDGKPVKSFKYQRLGDTRYSMIDNIVGTFQSGWLGLGPPYADPITGETISATANIAISGLDRYAFRAVQFVQQLNGQVDPTDFAYGFDIERYMKEKLLETNHLTSLRPDNRAKQKMNVYFDALRARAPGGDVREAIGEVPPGRAEERMARLAGTQLEQKLISPDDIIAFGHEDPYAAESATLDESLLNSVSPLRGNNLLQRSLDKQQRIMKMGLRAMDPPEMIDDLLIGQAIKYRNLPPEELFKKLREDIYVAVTLHEVGHNTGLFHNMAGSSDALNFGKFFWEVEELDPDMTVAKTELEGNTDAVSQSRVQDLQNCIDAVNEIGGNSLNQLDPAAKNMTTQECLRQTEAMYSSIMDYHANWNSDFGGLGPYDLAATKFAYGQLLEKFAPGALKETSDTRSIKRRIFLNGWRTIPTDIVDGFDNIYNREYVKMEWNTSSTRQAPAADEVPYKFGYGAQMTPDEKPFDFGPDFTTNAKNELTRYFNHYFFTHFGRDRLWDFDVVFSVADRDVGTLLDFTEKMQWFFLFEATDPEFKGSAAEEDMLGATLTGLNLFGKVLGHPASGRYINAMKSDIFGLTDLPTTERILQVGDQNLDAASDIAIPWSNLSECSTHLMANTDTDGNGTYVSAKENLGFYSGIIPPSEGRPFFLGLTDDFEDWYVTYVGTYWTKQYALQLLGYNYAWFPRVDGNADPRLFDVSWYRLFPREVSKLFWAFITDHTQDIGPTMCSPNSDRSPGAPCENLEDGAFVSRDLLNPDLTEPDYSGNLKVLPSVSFNHQYWALIMANAYMSSNTDDTFDLPKSMRVALDGGNDDNSSFEAAIQAAIAAGQDPNDVVATFTHPVSGLTYKGLKVGEFPIAYDLIKRLNLLKERFQELDGCVADMDADLVDGEIDGLANGVALSSQTHLTDTYCECITADTNYVTGDCSSYHQEKPGEGQCQPFALRNRRDAARETMDDLVDYVGDLRTMNKYFGAY